MNPKHVTNLDLSKALFEAGITKDFESEFVWMDDGTLHRREAKWRYEGRNAYPALLLSELLELMPKEIEDNGNTYDLEMWYASHLEGAFLAQYYREIDDLRNREIYADGWDDNPLVALSHLATYLLREGKFNNNAK